MRYLIVLCTNSTISGEHKVAKFSSKTEAFQCAKLLQSLTNTPGHIYYVRFKENGINKSQQA